MKDAQPTAKEVVIYMIFLAAKGFEALAYQDRLMARIYFGRCVTAFCYLKMEILHQPLTAQEMKLVLSI